MENSYRLFNRYGANNFEGVTFSDRIARVLAEFTQECPNADINDVEAIAHQTVGAVCASIRLHRAVAIRKEERKLAKLPIDRPDNL